MRAIVIAAVAALAFAPSAYALGGGVHPSGPAGAAPADPQCKTGVKCGHSCIAKGKTCHIPAAKPPPNCGPTTQLCGMACIPKTKTCHK
jgi:hypothetical protein